MTTMATRPTLAPIPFGRLLSVESRKLVDTRGGKILVLVMVALSLAAIVGRAVKSGPQLDAVFRASGVGFGLFLTVLGILTLTSEWSHRTALTTFTLEPRRPRVLAAKAVPLVAAATAASLASILIAVPVTAVVATVQGVPADWHVSPVATLGWILANIFVVAQGFALGVLLLNAPAAIVICMSTKLLWATIGQLGALGHTLAEWLDLGNTTDPLTTGAMTGGDAARLTASVLFSIVVPLVIGAVRVIRKEVN